MSFGYLTTTTDKLFNWARKSSLWPMNIGLACCAMELMATGASHHDLDRFGILTRASPRQSDVLLIAGTVTRKALPLLKRLYDQMPEPKYVVAVGSCACGGSCFYYDNYAVVRRLDEVFPVDVYISGCPPRPQALLYGFMQLQEKITRSSKKSKTSQKSKGSKQ